MRSKPITIIHNLTLKGLLPYIYALIFTLATTGVLHILREVINPSITALLYLLPVGLSTVFWGLGSGIASAFIAFLAFNYFFITPYYTLIVHHTQDLLGLLVFLGVAVLISQLVGRTRQSLAEATAREREAIRLYELSLELSGLNQDRAIAARIGELTLESFQANQVEVVLEPGDGNSSSETTSFRTSAPLSSDGSVEKTDNLRPVTSVPLQTARGVLGDVRVWRNQPFSPAEERLLRTFASQTVLAIERARLLEADTRAKVLEESDRLKTSLLSSVSHELRSPLATIKASVTSLRSDTVPWDSEARIELLAAIEEESDHLNHLVGNLLNMSRIESKALKPEREWNVLAEIVSGVINRMRQRHTGEFSLLHHSVEIDIPYDLPLVPVDYVLMEQVFANLISNSVKYSPEHTTIRIQAQQVDENNLLVQVTNQGPPVAEEHLLRIFDKFYRVTAADRVTGTGLGLSICKGIVEAHGGQIWAENLAHGIAFKFSLPLIWEGNTMKDLNPHLPIE